MDNTKDHQRELETIRARCGYDFMALALAETAEHHYVIRWKHASGNLNDRFKRIVLQSGKGIAGIVFKTGKPVYIPSITQYVGSGNLFNYPIVQSERLESLAAVPLWNDGRVAGVLLGGFRSENQVTPEMVRQLEAEAGRGICGLNGKEMTTR